MNGNLLRFLYKLKTASDIRIILKATNWHFKLILYLLIILQTQSKNNIKINHNLYCRFTFLVYYFISDLNFV